MDIILYSYVPMLYMWTRNRSHVRYATCEENKNQYRIPIIRSMNRLFREKETDDIHRYNIMLYARRRSGRLIIRVGNPIVTRTGERNKKSPRTYIALRKKRCRRRRELL